MRLSLLFSIPGSCWFSSSLWDLPRWQHCSSVIVQWSEWALDLDFYSLALCLWITCLLSPCLGGFISKMVTTVTPLSGAVVCIKWLSPYIAFRCPLPGSCWHVFLLIVIYLLDARLPRNVSLACLVLHFICKAWHSVMLNRLPFNE